MRRLSASSLRSPRTVTGADSAATGRVMARISRAMPSVSWLSARTISIDSGVAQCRSSRTKSTGLTSASRRTSARSEASIWYRSVTGSAAGGAERASGGAVRDGTSRASGPHCSSSPARSSSSGAAWLSHSIAAATG